MRRALLLGALALGAAPLRAQVGYDPARSPFRDIDWRQSTTVYTGYYRAASDPAGVAPQGGPLVGVRYDAYIGGPASFTARLATVLSERDVLDPARVAGKRLLGTERRPLGLLDVGFTFALTGQKSLRGWVPTVNGGLGLVSNFAGQDPGGFKFGTQFALAYGAGVRYVPAGRWAFRAEAGVHSYQIRYPDRYFSVGLDSTSVLPTGGAKSRWTQNLGLTIGATYQLFR